MTTKPTDSFIWQLRQTAIEAHVINDVAGFLYPEDVKEGGYARDYAKNRIRSAIRRYRQSGRLSPPTSNEPKSLNVPEFLTFACKHWPQLTGAVETHGVIVAVEAPRAIKANTGAADAVNPPADPDELKKAFLKETKQRKREQRKRIELETELTKRNEEREKKRDSGRQVGTKK